MAPAVIAGLALQNPVQFHTQFAGDIPWDSIDMDFMNLNQTHRFPDALVPQKIVVGHWHSARWMCGLGRWRFGTTASTPNSARFGDNMPGGRDRDKVAADGLWLQRQRLRRGRSGARITGQRRRGGTLVAQYENEYVVAEPCRAEQRLLAARLSWASAPFLKEGGFAGFTTTLKICTG